jgi:rubrerythrin
MEGGIRAWEGLVAEGVPDAGMVYFPDSAGPLDLISLAWVLEDGSGRFYSEISAIVGEKEAGELFLELTAAEEHHKDSLAALYREISGTENRGEIPGQFLRNESKGDVMEGGMRVSEALDWCRGKEIHAILEIAISLEANSYDLYIKMGRKVEDPSAKRVFQMLSLEEKQHLRKMAEFMDRKS